MSARNAKMVPGIIVITILNSRGASEPGDHTPENPKKTIGTATNTIAAIAYAHPGMAKISFLSFLSVPRISLAFIGAPNCFHRADVAMLRPRPKLWRVRTTTSGTQPAKQRQECGPHAQATQMLATRTMWSGLSKCSTRQSQSREGLSERVQRAAAQHEREPTVLFAGQTQD